ncbi:hypothetical protein [Ketobacter sp.]
MNALGMWTQTRPMMPLEGWRVWCNYVVKLAFIAGLRLRSGYSGGVPKPSEITLVDIKNLRDNGDPGIAVKRFKQLPGNKKMDTGYGARAKVNSL